MSKKIAYSFFTAIIYSCLYYILLISPTGVGIEQSLIATLNIKGIVRLILIFPVAHLFVSVFFFAACYFCAPLLAALGIDNDEIINATFANIPVAIILALVFMALGFTVIGDIVL